jgi:hypothetical protein
MRLIRLDSNRVTKTMIDAVTLGIPWWKMTVFIDGSNSTGSIRNCSSIYSYFICEFLNPERELISLLTHLIKLF